MTTTTRNEESILGISGSGHGVGTENSQKLQMDMGGYATRLENVLGGSGEKEEENFLYQGEDSQEATDAYNEELLGFLQGLDNDVPDADMETERRVEELGDYATRLEEVLGGSDEEEEEDFLYHGEDSQEAAGTYNEQLLGFLQGLDDGTPDTDIEDERQVEEQLSGSDVFVYEQASKNVLADSTQSTPSLPSSNLCPRATSTLISDVPPSPSTPKPFLHPAISRLRSFVHLQHHNNVSSTSSLPDAPPSPSHFSAISRTSSSSNLRASAERRDEIREDTRDAFCWVVLHDIGNQIYSRKVASILGSYHGLPTVLTANGLICIGTDRGRVLVFDFTQHLKCVCSTEGVSELAGPVSALSLSHDHTYIAVGHTRGHINLYDISSPHVPARSVPPTSLPAVASGRKEGHIEGTRILSLAFVGARHTAIVSADESGLAFYHSLGKVLFVEANDTLRILGKYPETTSNPVLRAKVANNPESSSPQINGSRTVSSNPIPTRPWKPRKGNPILAMSALPLGTTAHPTEAYGLVALLTPTKLVIVGLKPLPRTWFRRHREGATSVAFGASKWRGCLAWFPSVDPGVDANQSAPANKHTSAKQAAKSKHFATRPVLAYSWGRTIYLLCMSEVKVKQTVQDTKNPGKTRVVEVGKVEMEDLTSWSSESDYLSVRWLNARHLLMLTATHLEVWDVRTSRRVECTTFDTTSLVRSVDSREYISHSVSVYEDNVFLLGSQELKVGTLLSWADRILAYVEDDDFINAIETARTYFLGTALGNRAGLPEDSMALRNLVGKKLRDLMTASALYMFSEERMTDSTHVTPDGRGVDRTPLFEGLVTSCTRACIALQDFEFLFEDLFEKYDDALISSIFLTRLEPFVLDGNLRTVPPRIAQRLVALHEERRDLGSAERIIWHIDPACIDINQAITLCRNNGLYDALIYVYTRSLRDFVTPVVELLELVRQIQRRRRAQGVNNKSFIPAADHRSMESLVPDAYKIFTYLADVLSGLTYPSQVPMPQDEALRAKKDVYHFLFKGISYTSVGMNGGLVLTSDEEGGPEQTYPYVRLLLRFDAEAFLHAMDIAFEDSYFNDDPKDVDRLVITRILLEVLSTPGLSSSAVTMLNIFIARNVPKYPQSIYMAPSALHDILVGLAEDYDPSTREDRQLAAEYLLSVYTPHDHEKMTHLFDDAEFFRILRTWYRQDHRWGPLVSTYLRDPHIDSAEIFHNIDDILIAASQFRTGTSPHEILAVIEHLIPQFLDSSIIFTAVLIDKHAPELHPQTLDVLGSRSQHDQFMYLRCLLEPSALQHDHYWTSPTFRPLANSHNLDKSSQELYIRLLCQFDSSGVLPCLQTIGNGSFDWEKVISILEENDVNEAVVWSLDQHGDSPGAFRKIELVNARLASRLCKHLGLNTDDAENACNIRYILEELSAVGEMGVQICHKYFSAEGGVGGTTVEDLWFQLLSSQIDTVQAVSGFYSEGNDPKMSQEQRVMESLRSSVQRTFTSLMSLGSTPVLSFPRLFKRLVDATSDSRSSSRSSYSEFRLILTGMLDSYRAEGDLLMITNRLVERDLFATVEQLAKWHARGSRIRGSFCTACKGTLQEHSTAQKSLETASGREIRALPQEGWFVHRLTGLAYHRRCMPSEMSTA